MVRKSVRRIPVIVVVPSRPVMFDIAGPIEVLRTANLCQEDVRFEVRYVGASPAVQSSIGLSVGNLEPLPDAIPADAMILLCGNTRRAILGDAPSDPRAEATHDSRTVDWLRARVGSGNTIVCMCSGSLLAARAGLLDGYACTTYHSDCAELARLAPGARVQENRLFVEDGNRFTSAGDAAGIDLMLHIVGCLTDSATEMAVARSLVLYLRRGGSDPQLSPWLEGRNHVHPAVHRVQDAIAADPAKPWNAAALSRIAATSPRHLARLFREQAGMSVTDYRTRLRVALARELLTQTRLDLERVAERSGFGSSRQLRRAWRDFAGGAPSDVRRAARS